MESSFSLNSNSDAISSTVLTCMLNFFHHHAPDSLGYRLPFVFPVIRLQSLKNINSTFSLLFRALDLLSYPFKPIIATTVTYLILPLSSVVMSETLIDVPKQPCSLLPISFLYECNPEQNFCLRPITTRVRLVQYPTLRKLLYILVSTNVVKFTDFFICAFISHQFDVIEQNLFTPVSGHRLFDLHPFLSCLLWTCYLLFLFSPDLCIGVSV